MSAGVVVKEMVSISMRRELIVWLEELRQHAEQYVVLSGYVDGVTGGISFGPIGAEHRFHSVGTPIQCVTWVSAAHECCA